MLKGVIFGLDGTLSNPVHRIHLAQAGAWEDYHDVAGGDVPHADAADLCRELQGRVPVFVVTDRDEAQRITTEEWLMAWGLYPDAVLMRPKGNRMKAADAKALVLVTAFNPGAEASRLILCGPEGDRHVLPEAWDAVLANASFSVDADPKTVEVYRANGLPCWQPRDGKGSVP